MSTKSRKRKIDQRAAKRWGKLMNEAHERRAGSTPSLIFEDEYANLLKHERKLVEEIKKEFGL